MIMAAFIIITGYVVLLFVVHIVHAQNKRYRNERNRILQEKYDEHK